jgi:hypothetical protein
MPTDGLTLKQFKKSQGETNDRLDALIADQQRTNDRLDALIARQQRTNELVEQLITRFPERPAPSD